MSTPEPTSALVSTDAMANRFNEASIQLPAALADKSIQMYMPADGGKDFSVVVSRNPVEPGETLEAFANRQLEEAGRALTRFKLETRRDLAVAGVPGVELTFSWRANGAAFHQRQAIFLAPGPSADAPTGLLITGTSRGMLMHPYVEMFEQTVASLQWRFSPHDAGVAANDESKEIEVTPALPFAGLPYVFGLSRRNWILYVFDNAQTACASIGRSGADGGIWLFFDAGGAPLDIDLESAAVKPAERTGPGASARLALSSYLEDIAGSDYFSAATSSVKRPALREHLMQYKAHVAVTRAGAASPDEG